MTDPTEATAPAIWWERLKAAPAYNVEKAKELCTSGKLKELAYSDLDAFVTLLDTGERYLPPPGNVAADLVSGLCKCVLNAYVNKINLEVLRDQCVDLLDLVLHLGHIGAFISTSRSSSEPLKLPPQFAKLMHRFNALVKEVIHYCKRYTREGMMAAEGKLFLETQHKQLYDELVTELRILARDALDQEDQEEVLKEVLDNCGRVNYGGDLPFVLDKKLEIYRDRLIAQDYSMFIHQPHLRAMWRKFLRHQQTVTWGRWWTVFPGELELDKTLDAAAKQQLVDLLQDKESKDAFEMASNEQRNFIGINELCSRFPGAKLLLQTVEGLVHRGRRQERIIAFQKKMKMYNAERDRKLLEDKTQPVWTTGPETPVKKEYDLNTTQARQEPGRQKVSPVQGGAQLFLSYRVPETGRKEQGGDRTVPLLKSALEAQGYSVFVGESDIEGGASWVQTIQVAITDCQVFIPVCSKTYGGTKWTLRELHAADEANKEILPLWHSGDYPPKPVSMYLGNVQRLPRGNQPLVQANFQSLVSDLVAAIKKAGCLPRNPPGPSNQALQGLTLDQGRRRV